MQETAQTPESTPSELKYAGFWVRTGASFLDIIFLAIVTFPLVYALGITPESELSPITIMINYVLPIALVLGFWSWKQATPGKLLLKTKIVDAVTLEKPSTKQLIIRYLGYIPSMLVLCVGFIWVAQDARKQGWHDKLAKTLVIYND